MCVIIFGDVVKISKVGIKSILKSSSDLHQYIGKGIKNSKGIIYFDDFIKTVVSISDKVVIERIGEDYLRLEFKEGMNKGEYLTNEGSLPVTTYTHLLKISDNSLEIKYDLFIDEHLIDTFLYILEYSIDR